MKETEKMANKMEKVNTSEKVAQNSMDNGVRENNKEKE